MVHQVPGVAPPSTTRTEDSPLFAAIRIGVESCRKKGPSWVDTIERITLELSSLISRACALLDEVQKEIPQTKIVPLTPTDEGAFTTVCKSVFMVVICTPEEVRGIHSR